MSPVILSVEARPRGVAAVTLDGADEDGNATTCLLPLESVVLHRLRSGTAIEDGEWRTLRAEGERTLATRRGLDLLARKQRTERELRQALARHFDERAVDGAIERLREIGYLDDAGWAKSYVASSRASDRGRALLRHELRHRGVEDRVAADALEAHDEHAAARTAAEKRVRSLRRLEPQQRRRRLYDFLRRRGFTDTIARRAMDEVLHDEAAVESSD
jgi:regulatory protein